MAARTTDPICRMCQYLGVTVRLIDSEGCLACPRCGAIDQNATAAKQYVDTSEFTGAIVDPENGVPQTDRMERITAQGYLREWLEHVEALIGTYLKLMNCPDNSNFRDGARKWYFQMRRAEQAKKGHKNKQVAIESRRLPYQVALATRMALQESNLVSLNNRVDGKSVPKNGAIMRYTKGDDRVLVPSLPDLFDAAHALHPDAIGYLDSLAYLVRKQRHSTEDLKNAVSGMDITLCLLAHIVTHIRQVSALPHEKRASMLITKGPARGGWTDDDFSLYTRITNWDDVLRIGYNLYQAQQCVSLWPVKGSKVSAIALALWSCAAVTGEPPKQLGAWEDELAGVMGGRTRSCVSRRFVEMKLFLCAWSTSIVDSGLNLPLLKPPTRNGALRRVGAGQGGWGGDKRRDIPPAAIAAASARTIAENWRLIMRTRCQTRKAAMPIDDEVTLARKIFTSTPIMIDNDRYKRSGSATSSTSAKSKGGSLPPRLPAAPPIRQSPSMPASQQHFQHPYTRPSSYGPSTTHQQAGPSRRTKAPSTGPEDDVERMIARGDDTSEDEGGYSSGDEDVLHNRVATQRRNHHDTAGLGLNIGELPRPFGFSVGLGDFSVDKSSHQPSIQIGPRTIRDSSSEASLSTKRRSQSFDSTYSDGTTSSLTETEDLTQPRAPVHTIPMRDGPSSIARGRAVKASEYDTTAGTAPTSARSSRSSTPQSVRTPNLGASGNPTPSPSLREMSLPPDESTLNILQGRNDLDSEHVGMLIREREQYILFRIAAERAAGRIVSEEVEQALYAWIADQRRAGTLPPIFTQTYLASLGIQGDPLKVELSKYIEQNSFRWSPLEALLRAGVAPINLPSHLIPHSVAGTKLSLHYWPHPFTTEDPADELEHWDESFDRDMDLLFCGSEAMDELFLTEAESKIRLQRYLADGWWDHLEDDDGDGLARGEKLFDDGGVGGLVGGLAAGYDVNGRALSTYPLNGDSSRMGYLEADWDMRDVGAGTQEQPPHREVASNKEPYSAALPPMVLPSRDVESPGRSPMISGSNANSITFPASPELGRTLGATTSDKDSDNDKDTREEATEVIDTEGQMIRDRSLLTLCSTLTGQTSSLKAKAKAKAKAQAKASAMNLTPAAKAALSRARAKAAKDRSIVPDLWGMDEMLGIMEDDDEDEEDGEGGGGPGSKRRGGGGGGGGGGGTKSTGATPKTAPSRTTEGNSTAGQKRKSAAATGTATSAQTAADETAKPPPKKRAKKSIGVSDIQPVSDPAPPYQSAPAPDTPLAPISSKAKTTSVSAPVDSSPSAIRNTGSPTIPATAVITTATKANAPIT